MKKRKERTFRIKPNKANDFKSITIRADDVKSLKDMFEDVDLDSNGVISRSELFKNLKKYLSGAHKFVNDYLHRLDADEDGVVSFRELLETLYPGGTQKEYDNIVKISLPGNVEPKKRVLGKLSQDEVDDFTVLFEMYDTDESGQVDIFEFKEGIQRTGLMAFDLCDTAFESMDKNEDGQISLKEFLEFFSVYE